MGLVDTSHGDDLKDYEANDELLAEVSRPDEEVMPEREGDNTCWTASIYRGLMGVGRRLGGHMRRLIDKLVSCQTMTMS